MNLGCGARNFKFPASREGRLKNGGRFLAAVRENCRAVFFFSSSHTTVWSCCWPLGQLLKTRPGCWGSPCVAACARWANPGPEKSNNNNFNTINKPLLCIQYLCFLERSDFVVRRKTLQSWKWKKKQLNPIRARISHFHLTTYPSLIPCLVLSDFARHVSKFIYWRKVDQ